MQQPDEGTTPGGGEGNVADYNPRIIALQVLACRGVNQTRRAHGQALVEMAFVMPLLIGIVAVLFQFGILFIAYLSIVHEMRDIGRWVAVHPDTIDGTSCSTAT